MNDIYGLALKQIRELETVIGEKIGADVYEERKDVNSRVEIASNLFATIVSYFEPAPEYLKNMNAEQFRELAMTTYRCMLDSTDNFDIKADDLRNTAIKNLVHIRGPKQILSYVKYVYGNLTDILERKKITTGMVGMFDTYSNYIDYIKMATYLFDADYRLEDFQYRFRTAEEINTAHDNTMQVYNLVYDQKNFEVQQGKFDTVWTKEKKEQFSFTGNIFSVIAPKNVLEIAHEGDALHHCVKSYIDSVVDGRTNILFVRRNEDLEKPFYTLEIQHDRIRQCHGFGNCNVDEEEGLEDFLKTYCEEKKFDFFNPDRVLAAGGR
jgi:hypothetical protein